MIPTACPTCSVPCLRNISLQPIAAVTRSDDIKQSVDLATVRVNYRFGGPVVAKY